MTENEPGLDPLKEDGRITSLNERLARAKSEEADRRSEGRKAGDGDYRMGNRVLAELIGGMVGGALIGWVLDRLLGTSPWLLLGLLFLGTAAAFRNIIRLSTKRPD